MALEHVNFLKSRYEAVSRGRGGAVGRHIVPEQSADYRISPPAILAQWSPLCDC